MNALAPLPVEPWERELIWGGRALAARYGKRGDPSAAVGESWECWDENAIAGGPYRGKTIAALRALLGRDLVGSLDPTVCFPILTKLIDAQAALSVQVHPGDAYARRVEGQPNGKTECWFVLEAQPGASIVLGWNRDTSRGEYLERAREGTLGDLLRHVPVHPGDVFYLPAGTLHAIGAGIVLFEAQQASDLTYRIFDYNRTGPDGKPRELHLEKAADVLDYGRSSAGALQPLAYELDGLHRETLVADARFALECVTASHDPHGLDLEGEPLVVMALGASAELEARGASLVLEPYETALVPAGLDVVMVRALGGEAELLTVAPVGDRDALPRRYSRAAVPVGDSTSFLAQF
jgi:mannose-6-phosphate isomerase